MKNKEKRFWTTAGKGYMILIVYRGSSPGRKVMMGDPKMVTNTAKSLDQCQRCGACCRKGGPSFHQEDRRIIESGTTPLADLYTIRAGEPAYDNVAQRVIAAPDDVIKIKGGEGTAVCRFFNVKDNGCTIYDDRPLECRVLKCWDVKDITDVYDKNRLSRKDLLSGLNELWDLVTMHQNECAYSEIEAQVKADDTDRLAYLLRYDMHIRQLTIEKTSMNEQVLEFLFGLPLTKTIRRYGVNPEKLLA